MSNSASNLNDDPKKTINPIGVLLCFMGLLAIAFSITLRVIPNVIQPNLLALLHTTPKILDTLNISYQYSLIATLIFSGIFIDIIGPRTVLVVSILIAVISNYLFARGDSLAMVLDARVLIGYSHPFILTSVLTLGTHWLPRRHFSLYVGLLFGTLLMFPIIIAPTLENITSRASLLGVVFFINLIGIIVILSIVLTERVIDRTRHRHTIAGLFRPLRFYKVWLISLVSMIGWIANTFLLQLGPFFLIRQYQFSLIEAMDTINTSFIFFGIGGVIMGIASDYLAQKRFLITAGFFIASALFSILFFVPGISTAQVSWLLFLTAFFTSSTMICYTKANDYCTIGNSGVTLGLVLAITTIGSSLFARLMRYIVQTYTSDMNNPVDVHYWHMTLTIVPILLLIGAIISMVLLKPSPTEVWQMPKA
jgi:MFS family permease